MKVKLPKRAAPTVPAEALTVVKDKVVSLHFTLSDDKGKVIDSSLGRGPLRYLHGAGNVVRGLERALDGKRVGDRLQIVVPPEDGYGAIIACEPIIMERMDFPDEMAVAPGMSFDASNEDGKEFTLWVTSIEKNKVHVTPNHPLAGQTLHFNVSVMAIRNANQDELERGGVVQDGFHGAPDQEP